MALSPFVHTIIPLSIMSIVALPSGEATCNLEDLKGIAGANDFSIKPDTLNEAAFLLFANAFDSTCTAVTDLPEYEDPRVLPSIDTQERAYSAPSTADNPLNAWAQKCNITSSKATAGRLAGRTVVVKDNVSVARLPLGLGCSPSLLRGGKHPTSPVDATVVGRILAAGGTIRGTATCENLSLFALSYTSHAGNVHNAWLPGYATGGSSSGCAALVSIADVEAARKTGNDTTSHPLGEGVDLAVGGDQGGSIRLPAAYSGIYGLKATHGLIPYTGIASLNPMIDHTGPMARSVEDIALLLGVMAGYDGLDPRMTPEAPLLSTVPDYLGDLGEWVRGQEWTATTAAKGLRIGILKESFEMFGLDPSVTATVKAAAERYTALGAHVKEVSIPLHKHAAAIWTISARPMIPHFLAGNAPDVLTYPMPYLEFEPISQDFFDTLSNRNPAVVNALMNAARMQQRYGPALAKKAMMHVHQLRAAYDRAFEEVDILLTPANPTVGPPHPQGSVKTESNPQGESQRILDLFEPAIGNTLNTSGFNSTGHPAMSMPVGWGKVKNGEGRLPVGMQLVARRWDEASILKAAKAWEAGGRWQDS